MHPVRPWLAGFRPRGARGGPSPHAECPRRRCRLRRGLRTGQGPHRPPSSNSFPARKTITTTTACTISTPRSSTRSRASRGSGTRGTTRPQRLTEIQVRHALLTYEQEPRQDPRLHPQSPRAPLRPPEGESRFHSELPGRSRSVVDRPGSAASRFPRALVQPRQLRGWRARLDGGREALALACGEAC